MRPSLFAPTSELFWETVERPGYFGASRDRRHADYNEKYGPNGWRLAWDIAGEYHELLAAVALYEDAYYEHLKANPDQLEQLTAEALDVYDDQLSNVYSRYDYSRQETERTHLQDIAIRRSVLRLGRRFQGNTLIQIRDSLGEHPLSMSLSPGHVPFHLPDLIVQPELEGWWDPGSVESFYQSNKYLQRRCEQPALSAEI